MSLELVTGLRQQDTPALAHNLVHGYAWHDRRTYGELLREAYCRPPPPATMERMVKALAVSVFEQIAEVESLAFSKETVPSEAKGRNRSAGDLHRRLTVRRRGA